MANYAVSVGITTPPTMNATMTITMTRPCRGFTASLVTTLPLSARLAQTLRSPIGFTLGKSITCKRAARRRVVRPQGAKASAASEGGECAMA